MIHAKRFCSFFLRQPERFALFHKNGFERGAFLLCDEGEFFLFHGSTLCLAGLKFKCRQH
ncbi:hypothetical protein ALP33_102667 [Pseudomonas amygdali pv. lachrymans]|uniref:Uncharacterized protein n=1 Tax=Pseudomonas amygdali pv. lachrymans TaxID=53707 RepID=A0AB37R392_PSEAV|nr:Unknown protein sequence [Pseudomonas amygdali pv. lachrymans]KPC19960.1 Unknown protein sequence [Pseudomonas amygdali pv. lachrymans]RMU17416.1 hypothetical protein ALP33_102667 [Pseudomonas amygdali pv. lachrymans]RMV55602.1 hypothetical protein ALP09_104044 [Pseudomonas amygdali pv. lachrymans]